MAATPDRSFVLADDDTVASIQQAHRDRCERSRENVAGLDPGDEVTGHGGRTVWARSVRVLRELAHHSGHADILRGQIRP